MKLGGGESGTTSAITSEFVREIKVQGYLLRHGEVDLIQDL